MERFKNFLMFCFALNVLFGKQCNVEPPELSLNPRRISSEEDLSQERTQLVNPNCPVRIMLEYIRKKCRLADKTLFDLCDENGNMKKLFSLPTYAYATHLFDHKKTYYLVVYRTDDRSLVVLPQLNRFNKLYADLQFKAKRSLIVGGTSDIADLSVGTPTKTTTSVTTRQSIYSGRRKSMAANLAASLASATTSTH